MDNYQTFSKDSVKMREYDYDNDAIRNYKQLDQRQNNGATNNMIKNGSIGKSEKNHIDMYPIVEESTNRENRTNREKIDELPSKLGVVSRSQIINKPITR